jgi:photosystem II stability/assembly factor-like uncharacterized protein
VRTALRFLFALLVLLAGPAHAQQWTPFTIPNGFSFVVGAGDPTVVLATQFVPDIAVRSADGGLSWSAIDVGGERPVAFFPAPTDPNVFYALTGSDGLAVEPPPRALYRSSDGGKTWQLVAARLQTPDGAVMGNIAVGALPDLLYASRMVATLCFTGSCSFAGAEGYVSRDGGRSWAKSDPPSGNGAHTAFPSASDARVVYATNYKGLFRSEDQGETWQLVLAPPAEAFIYERQVVVDRLDPSIVYGRFGVGPELWVTEDGGKTWRTSKLDLREGFPWLLPDSLESGRVYAVGALGTILESRDRGRSWQKAAESAGVAATNVNRTKPMIAIEGGHRVVYSATLNGPQRVVLFDNSVVASDLWWNPAQSGWGLSITRHASGQVFAVWFAYDSNGDPIWRVMPGGTWVDARTFSATIYETHGPPLFSGPPFDPSKVSSNPVGQATLVFDDPSNAVFRYQLDTGLAGETRITRQLFGPPADVELINYADLWWNPVASGWGIALAQQYANAFAVVFVYDDAGHPVWLVMPDAVYSEKDIGIGPLNGFHGNLFTTKGPPSGQVYDPSRIVVTPVGQASLRFDNTTYATGAFTYRAFGRLLTEPLARQPF